MFRSMTFMMVAGLASFVCLGSVEAQHHHGNHSGHKYGSRYVPHTTTHYHYVPHGNHLDVIPHTTTHFDRVNNYGWNRGPSFNFSFGTPFGVGNIPTPGYRSFYGGTFSSPGYRDSRYYPDGERYWGSCHNRPF